MLSGEAGAIKEGAGNDSQSIVKSFDTGILLCGIRTRRFNNIVVGQGSFAELVR